MSVLITALAIWGAASLMATALGVAVSWDRSQHDDPWDGERFE